MFIWGDTFLRNFYTVYDMEQKTLSFGVDLQGVGRVSMEDVPSYGAQFGLIIGL